uniref:Uncharacterized protein n=1 Tax=Rhizophora mucronata TaxID=61149 RepID=A0A2P2Q5R2_RHIMU
MDDNVVPYYDFNMDDSRSKLDIFLCRQFNSLVISSV